MAHTSNGVVKSFETDEAQILCFHLTLYLEVINERLNSNQLTLYYYDYPGRF